MRKCWLLLGFCLAVSAVCYSQTVSIKKIELLGDKLIVNYELDDSNPNNEYQISLYTSIDNYTVPAVKVTGDVGNEIKPGNKRKIEWRFREELKEFDGEIALEIRGKVFALFAKLQDFDVAKKYKRGKTYPLSWKPGNTNLVHIELFKGSERMVGELNHPNNGTYLLTIPPHSKPGDDYRIRISDSKRSGEFIYTDFFRVKPKIPLAVKAVGAFALVGGVIFIFKSGSKNNGESTSEEIPTPPGSPTDIN